MAAQAADGAMILSMGRSGTGCIIPPPVTAAARWPVMTTLNDAAAGVTVMPAPACATGKDGHMADTNGSRDGSQGLGCTQAQLRRFIKSRPYVPLHELRRRFDINGEADDVQPVVTREGHFWIGLPPRESGFLADLVDRGEIGLELCHDPCVNMVVGVFAMKPVGR